MEKGELQQFRSEDYLPFLDEVISRWFNQNYSEITEPQRRAIPLIHQKNNVLVSSPTGTGKTLTGFLSIINELLTLARNDELEDNIYCVYVSPLKALANDIDKNLRKPLDGIYKILRDEGQDLKKITLGVRSGDTPQSERQKMLRKPPNILITTPESLSLALSAPKFREKFASVRWAIIDEIHEISSTKRGSLLSVNLERLEALSGNLIRIGLSATQAPLDLIAEYLCGFKDGKPRPHEIIDVDTKKFLDLRTVTPVSDLTQYSSEVANNMMYDVLARYIAEHVTTIVFTNTRSSTEHVAIRLKARGVESIEAHHSSLGKETRHEVENKLKDGELKCVITSTSLELGIDIGYVDLVVQIGSPKSVSKGLQRIGRSGHGIHDLSMGRFLVFDLDDLMECAVLTKAAYDKDIDLVRIPRNPLDVLAQVIVGMSLEKTWDADEAYSVITSSFTFNTLSRDDYLSSLDYLSGSLDAGGIYPKIWYDKSEGRFGKKKSTRMIYYMNIGTIPDESDYKVINERGKHLGQLSEKFVERLKAGDVFVLGARTYLYIRTTRNRILVKDAVGLRPTVPSWTGEMLPRSYDLGRLIGKFRLELSGKLAQGDDVRNWLMEDYMLDASGAESMLSYMKNQSKFDIPTDSHLYVEGYTDDSGNYNIIFHVPLGRRVNDALSRAFAQAMSNKYNVNLRITVTDDGFMLTSSVRIPIREGIKTVSEANFEDMVRRSIWNTEVFKQRFRHCAARSLMVLRKYKGYDISVARQQLRSDKVLKYLESFRNFPVLKETFREIMEEMMDVPYAREYVKDVIDTGNYTIREYSPEPSPFSHGIILAGVSDIVLMEDRAKLLRQLQSKILDKVYGPGTFRFLLDDARSVELYFFLMR
ncbi:MAG: ATP-dependent helicase [Candidatus Thermoplasmatota archaeon]|nr:ATP-dependent helicase [Candidatus Thermoplasmatota archaeon]